MSEGVTGNVSEIKREWLHASVEYIPEGVVLMYDDQVPAHKKTKYPTWTISEENRIYEYVFDNFEYVHAYLVRVWKMASQGLRMKRGPGTVVM
jgi:hypothetical protein